MVMYAELDMNQRRSIQASIEHYDDRGVADLVAHHLFSQVLAPAGGYTVDQIKDAMRKQPEHVQLVFAQAYRSQLGAKNFSGVIDAHKVLFNETPRRLGIAALKALNVLDEQWNVRS